jgi:hypothetical protein
LIKPADYSPAVLRFIKTNELACLYVFAVAGRQPCKIGHALNLRHRHGLVQEAHAEEITIEHITWCPSAATAALIAENMPPGYIRRCWSKSYSGNPSRRALSLSLSASARWSSGAYSKTSPPRKPGLSSSNCATIGLASSRRPARASAMA